MDSKSCQTTLTEADVQQPRSELQSSQAEQCTPNPKLQVLYYYTLRAKQRQDILLDPTVISRPQQTQQI